MGFDFVNTRMYGATGPFTITSGSVTYQAVNANISNILNLSPLAASGSASLVVRNGMIIQQTTVSSSTQPF
jgi:hypothetical protein